MWMFYELERYYYSKAENEEAVIKQPKINMNCALCGLKFLLDHGLTASVGPGPKKFSSFSVYSWYLL